ncbi:MAG: hypothetical protein PGN34_12190 [Methylobacterium frigidaeris]
MTRPGSRKGAAAGFEQVSDAGAGGIAPGRVVDEDLLLDAETEFRPHAFTNLRMSIERVAPPAGAAIWPPVVALR